MKGQKLITVYVYPTDMAGGRKAGIYTIVDGKETPIEELADRWTILQIGGLVPLGRDAQAAMGLLLVEEMPQAKAF